MSSTIVLRTRDDRVSLRFSPRTIIVAASALALIVVATAIAVYTGQRPIEAGLVTRILVGDYAGATGFDVFTVLDNRLPRALAAVAAGLCLGFSGAAFQSITANPLGSPDIIGFTSGASAGALIAIVAGAAGATSIAAGALVGGIVAAAAVYALAWRRGIHGYRLLLVGIAVGAVLSSIAAYVLSRAEIDDAMAAYRWTTGGLAGRGWDEVAIGVLGVAVVLPAAMLLHRPLSRLAVGSDLAQSQGLAVGATRTAAALCGTVAVALAVCVAGPIGFIALAAPHIARLLQRTSGPALLTSALFGAALLSIADVLALRLFSPTQLPTGILTAVLGGVYIVWLLQRRTRRRSA